MFQRQIELRAFQTGKTYFPEFKYVCVSLSKWKKTYAVFFQYMEIAPKSLRMNWNTWDLHTYTF